MAQLVHVPAGRAGAVLTRARTNMPGVSSTGERSGAVVIPKCVGGSLGPTDSEMPGVSSALNHSASALAVRGRGREAPSRLREAPAPAESGSSQRPSSTADSPRRACHAPRGDGRCRVNATTAVGPGWLRRPSDSVRPGWRARPSVGAPRWGRIWARVAPPKPIGRIPGGTEYACSVLTVPRGGSATPRQDVAEHGDACADGLLAGVAEAEHELRRVGMVIGPVGAHPVEPD
jgi:hypothetical protein